MDKHGKLPASLDDLGNKDDLRLGCPAGPVGNRYIYDPSAHGDPKRALVSDAEAYHDGVRMALFGDGRVERVIAVGSPGVTPTPLSMDLGFLKDSWGYTAMGKDRIIFRSRRNFILPDSVVLGFIALMPHLESIKEHIGHRGTESSKLSI